MSKRAFLAIPAVFITWLVVDSIVHRLILGGQYEQLKHLFRPWAEMKMCVICLTVLVASIMFVFIYARFFAEKNVKTAGIYGLAFGLAAGTSMGFGSYAAMPIPYDMAQIWFLGTVAEAILGGLLMGWIVEKRTP